MEKEWIPRGTSATGYFCEQKTIFVTPFTRLARVRITPRRPRAINTILLQMTEAFITDVTGCIVVTADGHTTVRTGDVIPPEWLFTKISTTAGTNLRGRELRIDTDQLFAVPMQDLLQFAKKAAQALSLSLGDSEGFVCFIPARSSVSTQIASCFLQSLCAC